VQPLATAYEAVVKRGEVQPGNRVLIIGSGVMGLGSMLVSRMLGAQVMAADVLDYRLRFAEALGADAVARADADDFERVVLEWTDGRGADVAIEAVGGSQGKSFEQAQRLTRPRGRVVIMGSFSDEVAGPSASDLMRRELTLVGSIGHPRTFGPTLVEMAVGRLQAGGLISHRVPLESLADAFRMFDARSDGAVKVVVEP
jgi:alcohol dehydrogenase